VVLDVTRLAPEAVVALVRAVRAVTARLLLVLVAPHDGETGPAALDAGADDFLRPPVVAPELQAQLTVLLRPARNGRRYHRMFMFFSWASHGRGVAWKVEEMTSVLWVRGRTPRWRDDRSAQRRTHGQRLEWSKKEARTWHSNYKNDRLVRP
jgi:DNA-binding response OmpR family regulator